MSRTKLSRRTMLRGMLGGGAVMVGLPPLQLFYDSTGTRDASGSAFPKRFGIFFWGNGVIPDQWVPTGEGAGWTPSQLLAPLAELTGDVTVVTGLSVRTANVEPHLSGVSGLLSGAPLGHIDGGESTFGRASIDQVIAAKAGLNTRFRSLEFGVRPKYGYSFNGADNRNPPETSVMALFDRVFGGGYRAPGSDAPPDPTLRLRRSILDAVGEDATTLRKRLGAADRIRLDQHLEGVRALERRIALIEENPIKLDACVAPQRPTKIYPDIDGRPQLSAINRAFTDLAVMALACDQTRVFSNWFTAAVNNVLFPGAPLGHHQLTHDELGDQPNVAKIVVQIIEEYAYMVRALKAVPEGDGTLLDHTVLLGTSDCAFGRTHTLDDYPILLAGSCGGALKRGIHYRSKTGDNASRAMLSLIRAMDVPAASFGDKEGYVTDSLQEIEA